MQNNNSIERIIYPATLVSLIIVTIAFAFLTIDFVSSNINKAFVVNEKMISPDVFVDVETYNLITKKLNITVEGQQIVQEEQQATEESQ
jgi:hypothetical protein